MSFSGAAAWNPVSAAAVLLLLILAGAFFTAGKIAVLSLNKSEMGKLAEEGDDKAKKLLALTADTARFLSVARGGAAVSGMLAAAVAAAAYAKDVARLLSFLPFSPAAVSGISTVLVTLLFCCLWAVFGDMVPKKIALSRPAALSRRVVGSFSALARVFGPVAVFLSRVASAFCRLPGAGQPAGGQTATEEEILLMMEAGRRNGLLGENEKDMISNIFDFGETSADEAMTHRTDVTAAEDTDSIKDVVAAAMENGYSRIPVYHEDLDHVTGIIYVKDLLSYVGRSVPQELSLEQMMRPAYFVPKSKSCGELFSEMRLRKIQIAVVVDEYGGTEGIITMEDLLEAIVGSIQDEYDHEEEEIHRESENRFDVEGTAPVDEVSDLLGVALPEGDYDTVAGLMMERLGRLPKENEHPQVRLPGLTLTVAAMEERRIARILIEKDAPVPKTPKERKKGKN
jgi:putative hemolysin